MHGQPNIRFEDLCSKTEHFLITLQDHAVITSNYRKQTHISNEPVVATSAEDAVLTRKQNKMSGRNQWGKLYAAVRRKCDIVYRVFLEPGACPVDELCFWDVLRTACLLFDKSSAATDR